MQKLLEFLKSDTFGFLLKLFAGIATAGFGMFGLGTTTRTDDGKLNRNGRLALIGILVAAVFAMGTSIFDFASSERAAKDERAKALRLLLTVKEGLYPLKEVRGQVTVLIPTTNPPFDRYEHLLQNILPKNARQCQASTEIACINVDAGRYGILPSSRYYPARMFTANALQNIHIRVTAGTRLSTDNHPRYKVIRYVAFGLPDPSASNNQEQRIPAYYDASKHMIEYTTQVFLIPDDEWRWLHIYSLADLFPGFIATSVDYAYSRHVVRTRTALLCTTI